MATVDQDATIIGSHKQQALRTYEGERGYQPMLAVWAEMDVVLADKFRDGNVPAMMGPLAVAKRAFAVLPETVTNFYYRGDSASHEKELLGWHREKAGTVEGAHDVLKNELAGGVMPSKYFGANAAWLRLAVDLAHPTNGVEAHRVACGICCGRDRSGCVF